MGGVVPLATDDVVIVNGDLILSGTTSSISVSSFTIQTGGSFCQQIGVTGTGTFTLAAGSW